MTEGGEVIYREGGKSNRWGQRTPVPVCILTFVGQSGGLLVRQPPVCCTLEDRTMTCVMTPLG